jgi:hypothetical protein
MHNEEQFKDRLAGALCAAILLGILLGGVLGIFVGYGLGFNKERPVPELTGEIKDTLSDYEILQLAIIYTESEGNPLAIGKNNDLGCLQITPVYVEEVRRITKDTLYHHTDAFCPKKSLEMFSIIQNYHNPEHDIDAAIRLHNRAPWYSQKVLKNVQRIKAYEEYRKLVKEGEE